MKMSPMLKMLKENQLEITAAIQAGCACSGCKLLSKKLEITLKLIRDELNVIEQTEKAQLNHGKPRGA